MTLKFSGYASTIDNFLSVTKVKYFSGQRLSNDGQFSFSFGRDNLESEESIHLFLYILTMTAEGKITKARDEFKIPRS